MSIILIVDDRPVNREFLMGLLRHAGHRLLEAADGAEALRLLRTERPDLVITDILMPTMDGFDFAVQVRSDPDPALAKTPIIFYSATYNAREARALAQAAAVAHVLAKPAEPQLILDTVNVALGLAPAMPLMVNTQSQPDSIQVIAGQLADMVGELDSLGRRLAALVEVMVRLTSEREPERLLNIACVAARAIVASQYAVIGTLADDRKTLRHFVTSGMDAETYARIGSLPTGQGVLGKLLADGKPLRLRDMALHPDWVGLPPGHPPMRSFLGVPILTPAGLYGWLYLTEKTGAAEFSDEDERVAVALAAQVAVAYENALRYDEIQSHAARLQLEITQRKQAEAELADSEERFRSWVEKAMDLITVVDMKATIHYESPSVERLLGYAPSELVGRSALDFIHPDDRGRLLDLFRENESGPATRIPSELRMRDREGAWRDFEAIGSAVRDRQGRLMGLIHSRDISERKRAEEARARLVDIIEATTDFVAWAHPDGRVVYINRAGRQMVGVGVAEDISNTHISDYAPAWANFVSFNEGTRSALAHGYWSGEGALLARGGHETPVSQVILAHQGPNGEVLYLSTISRDISERKQAEAALRTYARQEAAVAEIGQRALTQADVTALLDEAAGLLARTLEVEFCEVMELEPDGKSLRLRAGVGWRERAVGQTTVGAGISSQAGYTLHSDGAVVSDDLSAELRFELPDLLRDHGAASGMSVAIRRRDGAFGVLGVFSAQARKFSADDVHFLEAVANVLGQAVEHKQAEAALAQTNDLLSRAEQIGDIGSWSRAVDTGRVAWSDGLYRVLGLELHQCMPTYEAYLERLHPDDRERVRMTIEAAARQQGKFRFESRVLLPDGRIRFLESRGELLLDEQGHSVRLVGIAIDITERKQRERELEAIAAVIVALRIADTQAQMLPIILEQVTALLNADAAALALRDPATDQLVVALGQGDMADLAGRRLPAGAGIAGQALATRQPYVTDDIATDPHFHQLKWLAETRAAACVPLITNRQVLGVLWAKRAAPFTEAEVRVLSAIGEIAASAIQRAGLHEQTEQRLQRLAALREIDGVIMNSLDLPTTLAILLGHVTGQLGVDAGDILLLSRGMNVLEWAAGRGFHSKAIEQSRQRLGEGYAGQAALERRRLAVPDLRANPSLFPRAAMLAGESFAALFCVPLIAKAQVLGVLEVWHRTPLNPDADWLGFLETLAGLAAIAVADAWLFNDLQRSNMEMLLAYDTTLEGWSAALDLRDKETEGHSQRVTDMTLRLARALNVSAGELEQMRRGALLHDIGKMGVPDAILLKPSSLTDDEWVIMRQHPTLAYELLSPIAYLRPALDIPYCHHEKWDGSGYPRQLKGDAIPLSARIFAVVDVWDALRSNRPYRPGWQADEVRIYIRDQAGKHFDPRVVEAFLGLMGSELKNPP